ncbi:MAG: DUF126 domain-containing protein [Acetobacteraceae bacterium]|nr:DUF126 domain-containing protein [Acetobacteraceae bacterium]
MALAEPLSFWGGLEIASGRIIDRWHPDHGACLAGRVVVMASGRGSSSASSVLAETVRLGTAPAGIVLRRPDEILTIGALVAASLYDRHCPIVVAATDEAFAEIASAKAAAIDGGTVVLR